MVRALERGLTVADFEILTFGMLIDYIVTYNNVISSTNEEPMQSAAQSDFNAF